MESPRRTMPPPGGKNELPDEEASDIVEDGGQDGVDQMLTQGLRKLYDPILEEEVPAEMLEILRGRRKRP